MIVIVILEIVIVINGDDDGNAYSNYDNSADNGSDRNCSDSYCKSIIVKM